METTHKSIRETRIQKLTDLIDKGINPYAYSYDKNEIKESLSILAISKL